MTLKIKVFSDYVCPFCLLAKKPLDEVIEGKDVEVEWMPFELRPYPTPTLEPEGSYLQNAWSQSIYPMAERMGIPIVLPNVSPQPHTHLAFEGYQYAKEQGKGSEYNDRLLRAFFQEEQNIGNIDVLTQLAGEIGLDQIQYRKALESRKYKDIHQEALKEAHRANITAVPTIIIGGTQVSGMRSKEVLEEIINEELAKQIR